ncbi:aldo/keto reductase [Bradyrhizobium sp. Arg314]
MRYNQLGNTGLFVSEFCLGALTFGPPDETLIASLDQKGVNEIVGRSIAAGINFFDTADVYSFGQSERLLGQSFKDLGVKRSDVIVATKVHCAMGEGPNQRGSSRGHIMNSIDGSLERLRTDYVDLYQLHANDTVTPIDETLRALDDLVSSGKVRYLGLSNWQAWRIAKALGIAERLGYMRFETVQSYYSIAGRDLEREIVPLLNEEKLGLMVWSPMAGGLLSGKYGPGAPDNGKGRRNSFNFPPVNEDRAWAAVAVMREIAKKYDVSVATVALGYVLKKPFVMSVIIGASCMDQLEQNLAATGLKLRADDLAKLDEVSALPSEYPGWMLERQDAGRRPAPFVPNS